MSGVPTTASLVLAVLHFGCLLAASLAVGLRGRVDAAVVVTVCGTLAAVCISFNWGHEDDDETWSAAGNWGLIAVNFSFLLLATWFGDRFVHARVDILGRALARTAASALVEAEHRVDDEDRAIERKSQLVIRGQWQGVSADGDIHDIGEDEERISSSACVDGADDTAKEYIRSNRLAAMNVDDPMLVLIARTLPRAIFLTEDNTSPHSLDDELLRVLETADDTTTIYRHVLNYRRRQLLFAVGAYALAIAALVAMATLQYVRTGGLVFGWFDLGWIIASDSLLLLGTTTQKNNPSQDGELDWISKLPRQNFVSPPVWFALLLLLLCRGLLITVPLHLHFAAQCLTYIVCSTYLGILISKDFKRKCNRSGSVPYLPLILLVILTLWLTINTVLVGMTNTSEDTAEALGGSRHFVREAARPVQEWVLGVASVCVVITLISIYYAIFVHNQDTQYWLWALVYAWVCLTGFAVDCIAAGTVSISLGVFVSVVFLFPCIFIELRCIIMSTLKASPPTKLFILQLLAGFLLLIGWSFSLRRVNPDVSFIVFVISCEVQTLSCFMCIFGFLYHCVGTKDSIATLSIACFGTASYIAILPVGFLSAPTGETVGNNSALAVTVVSFALLPGVILWIPCSVKFGEIGWDYLLTRRGARASGPRAHLLSMLAWMMVGFMLSMIASFVLCIVFFSLVSAIWLVVGCIIVFFLSSALQAQLVLWRPFRQREVSIRTCTLFIVILLLVVLTLIDGAQNSFTFSSKASALTNWAHFLIASYVLFICAIIDYVLFMFSSVPNQIISPSPYFFGFPIVTYVIHRKGGEIFVHNNQILVCLVGFVLLDIIGLILGIRNNSKVGGATLSCVAYCMILVLGFFLKSARAQRFRKDIAQITKAATAEDAFVQVLQDTIGKIRQFSSRTTVLFERYGPSCCSKRESSLSKKEKKLGFFFVLFSLSARRSIRLSRQELEQQRQQANKPENLEEGGSPINSHNTPSERFSSGTLQYKQSHSNSDHGLRSDTSSYLIRDSNGLVDEPKPDVTSRGSNHVTKSDKFEDPSFVPSSSLVFGEQDGWDSSLESLVDEDELVVWLRPDEICASRPWGVRSNKEDEENCLQTRVDARQVQQGNVADCWLLSAISVVALNEDLLNRILPAARKHLDGKYCLSLFDFSTGDWFQIEIDDRLPCDPDSRKPMFASSRTGDVFWVSLIEKAFAKRHGGWPNLDLGQVHRALVDLTGGFSQLFAFGDDFEMVESGAMWAMAFSLVRQGQLLVLGSKEEAESFGLVPDHAYAVLGVVEFHDSRGRHRLMLLQDPWGRTEWKGNWGRNDVQSWTPRAKRTVYLQSDLVTEDTVDSEDGTFWMEFNDVIFHFKWLFACSLFSEKQGWLRQHITGEWNRYSAGGPPNQPMTRFNPQYQLRLLPSAKSSKRHAVIFISMCNIAVDLPSYPFMSLLVLYLDGKPVKDPIHASQVVASTGKFRNARELSIEVSLPIGKTFTLLPSLFRIGELGSFRISCYSKNPFELKDFT